jgi:hypothetical protein
MAIVPARIGLELYDSKGGGGTFLLHASVSDASTLSGANTAVATAATMLRTVSNAGIKQGNFTLLNKAVAVAPDDTTYQSDIGFGAVFNFSNADLISRTYGQLVSSFLPNLVESNGSIDITATVQAAFIVSMLDAVLGGNYTDSGYSDLTGGLDAFRTNRKLRRRLRP